MGAKFDVSLQGPKRMSRETSHWWLEETIICVT